MLAPEIFQTMTGWKHETVLKQTKIQNGGKIPEKFDRLIQGGECLERVKLFLPQQNIPPELQYSLNDESTENTYYSIPSGFSPSVFCCREFLPDAERVSLRTLSPSPCSVSVTSGKLFIVLEEAHAFNILPRLRRVFPDSYKTIGRARQQQQHCFIVNLCTLAVKPTYLNKVKEALSEVVVQSEVVFSWTSSGAAPSSFLTLLADQGFAVSKKQLNIKEKKFVYARLPVFTRTMVDEANSDAELSETVERFEDSLARVFLGTELCAETDTYECPYSTLYSLEGLISAQQVLDYASLLCKLLADGKIKSPYIILHATGFSSEYDLNDKRKNSPLPSKDRTLSLVVLSDAQGLLIKQSKSVDYSSLSNSKQ